MKPTSPFDELWGTFAVDDHKRERAFVAEVILFDRLVVPQPPENDAAEWAMWIDEDWRPDLLKATVDALEDLIIPVPWDKNLRRAWKGEYKSLFGGRASLASNVSFDFQAIRNAHPDNPAMWTTRMVLANKLNAEADEALFKKIKNVDIDPAANIEAVVGYGSYARFRQEVPMQDIPMGSAPKGDLVPDNAFLFQWDFVVPEDSHATDAELLERAAKLSRQSEFRDSRRRFHEWRRRLIANQVAVDVARGEMDRCLAAFNDLVDKSRKRSRTLTALQVISAAVPLADLIHPGAGVAGGVTFGLGAILADKFIPEPQMGEREKIAALVHDSREAFGWHA